MFGNWENYQTFGSIIEANWGQWAPYNLYAPVKDAVTCPAGCTATATAIIMYHFGQPSSYDGYAFDWTDIKKHKGVPPFDGFYPAHNMIGKLCFYLNIKDNLDAEYGVGETGANEANIPRTLANFGYTHSGTYNSTYNYSTVKSSLVNGKLVNVTGYAKKTYNGTLNQFWV
jgi:hypothetical protein